MTHPLLAFRHFAGDDSRYRHLGGAAWLRALVDHAGATETAAVPVAWGRSLADVPGLESATAFVGVNCRECTDERLRAVGLTHVRRFAVLPGIENARWFVPLDSARASAAALSIYHPVRASARALHAAARTAARSGLPLWYRDQVCVARRAAPPLERLLERLFPGDELRLAMSCGESGRARHRKLAMAIVSMHGKVLAFVKTGSSALSQRLVRHEAEVLRALATRARLAPRLPRVLFDGQVADFSVNVQTPLAGSAAGTAIRPPQRVLLAALRGRARKAAVATGFVESLRARVGALPSSRGLVAGVMEALVPRLACLAIPATIVHGDFAPWNLRIRDGIAAAFDWEYAELDGLPLIDECNHLLLVGYLMHGWTPEAALGHLRAMVRLAPLGLERSDVEALQLVHLVDLVTRFVSEGAEEEPMTRWFMELLVRLSRESELQTAPSDGSMHDVVWSDR